MNPLVVVTLHLERSPSRTWTLCYPERGPAGTSTSTLRPNMRRIHRAWPLPRNIVGMQDENRTLAAPCVHRPLQGRRPGTRSDIDWQWRHPDSQKLIALKLMESATKLGGSLTQKCNNHQDTSNNDPIEAYSFI